MYTLLMIQRKNLWKNNNKQKIRGHKVTPSGQSKFLSIYIFIERPTFFRSWSNFITLTFTISPTETTSEGDLI